MRAHPAGPRHGDLVVDHALERAPDDLNLLDAHVWPESAQRQADGAISIAGHDARRVAEEFGTPAIVLDEQGARKEMQRWREAFADGDVYYAAKAFLSRGFARWVAEEGLSLDVCTGGELEIALSAGFAPERILVHGNNKSPAELAMALDAGVGRIVVDSFAEIARLAFLAEERGLQQEVFVRVTTGVEAHTHEFIATAHEDQKFGFSLAGGDAAEAVRRVLKSPSLRLVGLHSHIGSQIFDTEGFEVAAARVAGLLSAIRDEHQVTLPELNLGGGFGIAYRGEDDPQAPAELATRLRGIVDRVCADAGLPIPRLAVEPGRAVVGRAGVTLYEVGTVKDVDGLRTYVSVDGGMSDNIRTALYDADYTVALASRASDAPPMLARVVGKHCESGDVVVRDAWLPADLAAGDLLAVAATGAYCRSMASNYNVVPRPPVLALTTADVRTLIRRETVADLLATDVG